MLRRSRCIQIFLETLGQQYNIGEKPTVILYTYINRHAGTIFLLDTIKTAKAK